MNPIALLMGLAGGFASALLFAAVLGGGALATPLFALSPLPIAIAAIGWGTISGASAAAVASVLVAIALAPVAGLVFALAAVGPIAWYGHLAGLARADGDGRLEWYPLDRVFLAMVVFTPISLVSCGYLLGVSVEDIAGNLADMLVEIGVEGPDGTTPDRAELMAASVFYVRLMPVTLTMVWLSLISFNLWLAGRIVQKSDRLRRPWQPVPTVPALPVGLLAALAVAVVLALGESALALAFGSVAGALAMAFALQGFATLHILSRGNPFRGLMLGALYALTFLFSLPLLPVAALGAADAVMGIRRRRLAAT